MSADDRDKMYQIGLPDRSDPTARDSASTGTREQLVQLLEASEDKHFVFLFGSPAAGKTAVLGSIIQAMQRPEVRGNLYVHGNGDSYFKHGLALWNQIRQSFQQKRFPTRSTAGNTIQLHAQYKPATGKSINLIFLEMAGDDLQKVMITDQGGRSLPFHIGQFLRIPQLKLVFLITTPWTDAAKDDAVIDDFLSYINESAPHLIDNRMILLVTKWDTHPDVGVGSIDEFIRKKMPRTFNKIAKRKNIVQPFSVGKIVPYEDGEGDIIASFDYTASQRLFARIIETFTGVSSEPEKKSFWKFW